MPQLRNIQLSGANDRPFLLDVQYPATGQHLPIIVFVHGFKGFKDWGHWSLLGERFAEAGFVFVKINLSHNGTIPDQPLEFGDLEAFGQNNYSKELTDLDRVFNWLEDGIQSHIPADRLDLDRLGLIGHSRGGALCIIKAAEDERVKSLVTWASVSRLDYAWLAPGFIADWEKEGVYYALNGRTKQQMPLYFQLYEDFAAAGDRYQVAKVLSTFEKPYLIIHGDADPGVPPAAAHELKKACSAAQLALIPGADHVFQGQHPYTAAHLPPESETLLEHTRQFFEAHL